MPRERSAQLRVKCHRRPDDLDAVYMSGRVLRRHLDLELKLIGKAMRQQVGEPTEIDPPGAISLEEYKFFFPSNAARG